MTPSDKHDDSPSTDVIGLVGELRTGLEGVTPGPWAVASDLPAYAIMAINADGRGGYRVVQTPNQNNYRRFGPSETWNGIQSVANAKHIARCSPDNITALLDALSSAEARALAAEGERDDSPLVKRLEIAESDSAFYSKTLQQFRETLLEVIAHMEDEGDRVYFGSTNNADSLREITHKIDGLNWDDIMASSQPPVNLYEIISEQRARADAAEADNKRLRDALEDIAVFTESHFREGDKEYQPAIVARQSLKEQMP